LLKELRIFPEIWDLETTFRISDFNISKKPKKHLTESPSTPGLLHFWKEESVDRIYFSETTSCRDKFTSSENSQVKILMTFKVSEIDPSEGLFKIEEK
jgi:hypothetical protein